MGLAKIGKYIWMYTSVLLPRDKSLVVFGAWLGERFTDNSMQLFLEASEVKALKCVWITKNPEVYKEVKSKGLKCAMWGSKTARRIQQKAGYAVVSNGISDLEHIYLGGAVILDLWHGIPLKKIGFDNLYEVNHNSIIQKIKRFFKYFPLRKLYYFAPSENFREIYKSAFKKSDKYIKTLGQPRNDIFFEERDESDKRKYFPDKKIILYCPTHRQEGAVKQDIGKLFDLDRLNKFLQNKDYFFVIKKHFYHREEVDNNLLSDYDRILDITDKDYDIQRLIEECSLLITDYSSIYIDYLLLDKPLMFYCYDYDDYIKNDREMYFTYDEVTPGVKAKNKDELMDALEKFSQMPDSYQKEDRVRLKDFFYCKKGQGPVGYSIISDIMNRKF